MKQHILHIGLIGLIGLISISCHKEREEYITQPTEIKLTILTDKITAGTAQYEVVPKDDRAYFYTTVIRAEEYIPGTMDLDYMMLVMDQVYIDYLTWRHFYLNHGQVR